MDVKIPKWLYLPNTTPPLRWFMAVAALETGCLIVYWLYGASALIPRPHEILEGFPELMRQGMLYHITVSYLLNLEALALSAVISLILAYASRTVLGKPIALMVSKMRFLGMVGFVYLLTITVGGGHTLKLALLTFGMTVFLATAMIDEVENVPGVQLDLARTLKMGEWHVLWEVVVLGTLDRALELIRQNAAVGWMMLSMVEGISRSEGGVGTLLLNMDKHQNIAMVFAIQLTILAVGLLQDVGLARLRITLCPYVALERGGK